MFKSKFLGRSTHASRSVPRLVPSTQIAARKASILKVPSVTKTAAVVSIASSSPATTAVTTKSCPTIAKTTACAAAAPRIIPPINKTRNPSVSPRRSTTPANTKTLTCPNNSAISAAANNKTAATVTIVVKPEIGSLQSTKLKLLAAAAGTHVPPPPKNIEKIDLEITPVNSQSSLYSLPHTSCTVEEALSDQPTRAHLKRKKIIKKLDKALSKRPIKNPALLSIPYFSSSSKHNTRLKTKPKSENSKKNSRQHQHRANASNSIDASGSVVEAFARKYNRIAKSSSVFGSSRSRGGEEIFLKDLKEDFSSSTSTSTSTKLNKSKNSCKSEQVKQKSISACSSEQPILRAYSPIPAHSNSFNFSLTPCIYNLSLFGNSDSAIAEYSEEMDGNSNNNSNTSNHNKNTKKSKDKAANKSKNANQSSSSSNNSSNEKVGPSKSKFKKLENIPNNSKEVTAESTSAAAATAAAPSPTASVAAAAGTSSVLPNSNTNATSSSQSTASSRKRVIV